MKVNIPGGRLQGEDSGEGLAADLVHHVVRVGERADDDFAVLIVPPAEEQAPTVEGGVPSKRSDAGRAGLVSQESNVQGAGYERP